MIWGYILIHLNPLEVCVVHAEALKKRDNSKCYGRKIEKNSQGEEAHFTKFKMPLHKMIDELKNKDF